MIKCFGRLFLLLLLVSGMTACSPRQKLIRHMEKDQRAIRKMERKELRRNLRSYKKEYRAWYKQQPKESQERLKAQKKRTKEFYKPYGEACTNTTPGITPIPHSKYKKNGIKK